MEIGFKYRGYTVVQNPFTGLYLVSKDGFHIATFKTIKEAKTALDSLA